MERKDLPPGGKLLFIGDSITDCGRTGAFSPLGNGYVMFLQSLLLCARPGLPVEFVNRGVSGNTVLDLAARWDGDVIAEKPDALFIMVGINDIHRFIRGEEGGVSPERFAKEYEALLIRTARNLGCETTILDPFYISSDGSGAPSGGDVLRVLPEYLSVTAALAGRHGAAHVRTHDVFRRKLERRPGCFFCPEPVHPNSAGHMVIAWELLRTLVELRFA